MKERGEMENHFQEPSWRKEGKKQANWMELEKWNEMIWYDIKTKKAQYKGPKVEKEGKHKNARKKNVAINTGMLLLF